MAKKTVDDLTTRVSTLNDKARALGADATPEARRTAKKALRRAQRRLRSEKSLVAARAPKAAADKAE